MAGRGFLALGERDRREGGERARRLGAHRHVRRAVLHRLEGADRPAELLPHLRVLDRVLERALGDADRLGGGEQGRERAQRRRVAGERRGGDAGEAHVAQAARRIDAGPPLHREAVRRSGEIASRPAAEDEEAPGRARVRDAARDTRESRAVAERVRWIVDEGHAQLARE